MRPEQMFDEYLDGTVQKDHQVDEHGVHLTVAEVLTMHGRGSLDFGGSEMKAAGTHPLEPLEHKPGEKYGWWRLDGGTYIVRFNERIKDGAPPMLLVSNQRLLSCGCGLAAACVGPGELRSVLTVPQVGVRIKENARIALLVG